MSFCSKLPKLRAFPLRFCLCLYLCRVWGWNQTKCKHPETNELWNYRGRAPQTWGLTGFTFSAFSLLLFSPSNGQKKSARWWLPVMESIRKESVERLEDHIKKEKTTSSSVVSERWQLCKTTSGIWVLTLLLWPDRAIKSSWALDVCEMENGFTTSLHSPSLEVLLQRQEI